MKHFAPFLFSLLLLAAACQGGKNQPESASDPQAAENVADTTAVADSTIYGTSDEFGMSTFTLISDKGDTLNVCRTANDGTDGAIYGDLNVGERYALTTRDGGEAIGVLINLSQLQRHVKNYKIVNGQLFVDGKPANIATLNDKELKLKE